MPGEGAEVAEVAGNLPLRRRGAEEARHVRCRASSAPLRLSGKFLLSHYLSAFVRTTPSNLSVGLTCAAAASVGAMSTVRTNSE